jgi:hypothetical protein
MHECPKKYSRQLGFRHLQFSQIQTVDRLYRDASSSLPEVDYAAL